VTLPAVVSRANEADELRPSDTRVLVVDDAPANLSLLKQLPTRALTTARPYKLAFPATEAFEELSNEARRGWRDQHLVDELVAMLKEAPHGSS